MRGRKASTEGADSLTTVQEDSRVMVDLILVNEDAGVFGYEVSVQDYVFCGTWGHRLRDLSNISRQYFNDKMRLYFCLTSEGW